MSKRAPQTGGKGAAGTTGTNVRTLCTHTEKTTSTWRQQVYLSRPQTVLAHTWSYFTSISLVALLGSELSKSSFGPPKDAVHHSGPEKIPASKNPENFLLHFWNLGTSKRPKMQKKKYGVVLEKKLSTKTYF